MKKLTTLTTLLTILALGCNAQEPHLAYSVEYVDSLNNKIEFLESVMNIPVSEVKSDSCNLKVKGLTDSTFTIIDKSGENITVTIQNGNKRVTSIFSEGERKTFFMNDSDTTKTVGSFQLDNTDKPLFYYNPDNR